MLSRILRSPLVSMSFLIIAVIALYILQQDRENRYSVAFNILILMMAVVWVAWFMLVKLHNRKYPNDKINLLALIPMEFREVDEGLQWITYKACRNVYIYYNSALPIAVCLYVLLPIVSDNGLFLLGALGLGQYIVYWLTIRKLNRA